MLIRRVGFLVLSRKEGDFMAFRRRFSRRKRRFGGRRRFGGFKRRGRMRRRSVGPLRIGFRM
ncbi:MAG: hypothetical protein [Wigfec virus K19_143]|nr:MAG: hypothetical protein [Wigfec virus K19_143]